jgi:maltokinase
MDHVTRLDYQRWLTAQRWYAGRGRTLTGVHQTLSVPLRDDVDLVLLDANYADGTSHRYQVVVRWDDAADDDPSTIGRDAGRTAHDALFDPSAARHLLSLIAESATVGALAFAGEPGADLPTDAPARVIGAEQSNTSVVFGDAAIFKVFRRVTPGINPDIELNRELARADNHHVARLLGSYATELDGQPAALGMVTEFAAGSTEGWDMATTATGDFAGESERLGAAVASVHRTLAATLGMSRAPFPTDVLVGRLHAIAAEVSELAPYVAAIEARYRGLGGAVDVQRVHGDLHLGQVLRTPQRWLVIDFEGEPGQPLAERRRPDSALRDVAGMLRSYAYAAHQRGEQRNWVDRNGAAFCAGYAAEAGSDPRDAGDLLAAYELDKAVYEAGYEARYRPTWLPIPLESIARLVG